MQHVAKYQVGTTYFKNKTQLYISKKILKKYVF